MIQKHVSPNGSDIKQKQQRLHRWNKAITVACVLAGVVGGVAIYSHVPYFNAQKQRIVELRAAKDKLEEQAPELRVRAAEDLAACAKYSDGKPETKKECDSEFNAGLAKIEKDRSQLNQDLQKADDRTVAFGIGLPLILGFFGFLISDVINDGRILQFLKKYHKSVFPNPAKS